MIKRRSKWFQYIQYGIQFKSSSPFQIDAFFKTPVASKWSSRFSRESKWKDFFFHTKNGGKRYFRKVHLLSKVWYVCKRTYFKGISVGIIWLWELWRYTAYTEKKQLNQTRSWRNFVTAYVKIKTKYEFRTECNSLSVTFLWLRNSHIEWVLINKTKIKPDRPGLLRLKSTIKAQFSKEIQTLTKTNTRKKNKLPSCKTYLERYTVYNIKFLTIINLTLLTK